MAQHVKLTPELKKEFIRLLSETGNVSICCRALNISRWAIYQHKSKNKKFAEQWKAAAEMAIALLEDESWRRAFNGVEKAVWYKGEMVGTERQFSDTLLMHRLNAERPDKYQYRQKVDANVTGDITFKWADDDDQDDNNTL